MSNLAAAVAAMVRSTPWLWAGMVLVVGLVVALLLRAGLAKILELVRFNTLLDRIGVTEFLRKGQVQHRPSRLVGMLAFWVVLVITFFQIARILDLEFLSSVSDQLRESAPSFVAAILIVVIGLVVVSFLANFVATLARTAALPHARLLRRVVRIAGTLIITILALEQVRLSGTLLSSLVLIVVAAGAFGAALAFGLGCKDLARDAVMKLLDSLRERGRISKGPDLEG